MNTHTTFTQQLRHWAFHIPIWALPSFILMAQASEHRMERIAAMLLGIALFTLVFTMLATLVTPLQPSRRIQKAILFGSQMRTALSLLSLPGSLMGNIFLMLPDFCTGYFSTLITNSIVRHSTFNDPFGWLFIATLIQASLIAFSFLLMAFASYILIQIAFQPMTNLRPSGNQ